MTSESLDTGTQEIEREKRSPGSCGQPRIERVNPSAATTTDDDERPRRKKKEGFALLLSSPKPCRGLAPDGKRPTPDCTGPPGPGSSGKSGRIIVLTLIASSPPSSLTSSSSSRPSPAPPRPPSPPPSSSSTSPFSPSVAEPPQRRLRRRCDSVASKGLAAQGGPCRRPSRARRWLGDGSVRRQRRGPLAVGTGAAP